MARCLKLNVSEITALQFVGFCKTSESKNGTMYEASLAWTESDSIDSCPLSPTQSTEWFNSAALERRIEHNVDISHDASPPLKE
ncbi:hypothetical protein LSAT2_006852 [Lamellibrachia satsuma]|nr:hypothetical protein LSAT2_006852 [Lamellibrachia satsuma]